jgi:hypothetical protein
VSIYRLAMTTTCFSFHSMHLLLITCLNDKLNELLKSVILEWSLFILPAKWYSVIMNLVSRKIEKHIQLIMNQLISNKHGWTHVIIVIAIYHFGGVGFCVITSEDFNLTGVSDSSTLVTARAWSNKTDGSISSDYLLLNFPSLPINSFLTISKPPAHGFDNFTVKWSQ